MKSLCIDARWLSTGIGTYTFNLVKELSRLDELPLHVLTLHQNQAVLGGYCDSLAIVDAPIYSVREQFAITWAAHDSAMLHVPHYNVPLLRQRTMLVTIHDLTHILDVRFRDTLKSWVYARPMLRQGAKKAAHIFTVSEYSKQQIVEHLDISPVKVTVTYNGVGPQFKPLPREDAQATVARECWVDGPFLLYVGNLKPHKNLEGLIRVFKIAKDRGSISHKLLIIGDDVTGRPALLRLVGDLGLNREVTLVASVTGDVLRAAYSGACLTILPSFEEGFGLPIIESMACGTPVACSSTASMPEVGGTAAEYFDPWDAESIMDAIERVVSSCDRWNALRQAGFEQAKRFTWESCAARHVEVYRRFLQSS